MARHPLQKPQIVADAVVKVIHRKSDECRFRNEVDNSGMSDAIIPHNAEAENITKALFTSYGIDGMLILNMSAPKAA